jgi:hypothetical protein
MPFAVDFDLDIPQALAHQLVTAFTKVDLGPLSQSNVDTLDKGKQGVYQLFHMKKLVYVGKADNVRGRLNDHLQKLSGRRGINIADMGFCCLYISRNWTALAPEETLIKHYRKLGLAEWNGMGFGPNDPGRQREETEKPEDNFDTRFPIKDDWPCDFVSAGTWDVLQLLVVLKRNLPFLLRYETDAERTGSDKKAHYTKGHQDFAGKTVQVPRAGMAVNDLLKLIVNELPGWQATVFPGYVTLYRETRDYKHGKKL